MTTTFVIRPVGSEEELLAAWAAIGGDRSDERRLADLRRACPNERDLLLAAYVDGAPVGAAFGFTAGGTWATLRGFGLADDDGGPKQQLLHAFEAAARTRGLEGIALGGGDEADVAFFVANGYRTQLLVQWVHDPAKFEHECAALLDGPLREMEHSTGEFQGVPQLFAVLDEPDVTVRSVVADLVDGAQVGYCMIRQLRTAAA